MGKLFLSGSVEPKSVTWAYVAVLLGPKLHEQRAWRGEARFGVTVLTAAGAAASGATWLNLRATGSLSPIAAHFSWSFSLWHGCPVESVCAGDSSRRTRHLAAVEGNDWRLRGEERTLDEATSQNEKSRTGSRGSSSTVAPLAQLVGVPPVGVGSTSWSSSASRSSTTFFFLPFV